MTSLLVQQIPSHVYSACDKTIQNSIVNSHHNFLDMDKTTMLKAIKQVVTKSANPAVHRMNFGNLMQHENELIKDFLVQLCSMAVDCEFICPACSHDLSNIKDQILHGLQNETLQADLLAKASQLKNIKDIVNHAEVFETAVHDQSQLHTSAKAQAAKISTYHQNKQQSKCFPQSNSKQVCYGCGSANHGVIGTPPQHSRCPGWGKLCQTCKKPNHFALVCCKLSEIITIIKSPQSETGWESLHPLMVSKKSKLLFCLSYPMLLLLLLAFFQTVVPTSTWQGQNTCFKWVSSCPNCTPVTKQSKLLVVQHLYAKDDFQLDLR